MNREAKENNRNNRKIYWEKHICELEFSISVLVRSIININTKETPDLNSYNCTVLQGESERNR